MTFAKSSINNVTKMKNTICQTLMVAFYISMSNVHTRYNLCDFKLLCKISIEVRFFCARYFANLKINFLICTYKLKNTLTHK